MVKKFERFKSNKTALAEKMPSVPPYAMPECLSAELLNKVKDGCRQLLDDKGYSEENPLEDIGIDGFYSLLDLFHFAVIEQRAMVCDDGHYIDMVIAQNEISGVNVVLYNKVEKSEEQPNLQTTRYFIAPLSR
ncbi:MAG: hypothetical protein KBC43_08080 [Bacteroidales bacterium]|nr:hypothetical protein [Bacteroidales bacterium]